MAEKKKSSAKKKKASEEASEMESRIMRVSMTKDEFKKFDEGETHSNNGVRTKKGSLSALPDIEEISEDDLPMLEQSYIKELVSEEAEHTMRVLVANKQILDKETVICFTDFLDGYLRNGELRIPLPALAKEE